MKTYLGLQSEWMKWKECIDSALHIANYYMLSISFYDI